MTELEVAGGWIHGYEPKYRDNEETATPRAALEQIVLPHLINGGCHIAFSGGRDSSALLAVAVQVARREVLPLPIPLTLLYPGAGGTEEGEWQDLVLNQLGLTDREVITAADEHDAVGPIATRLVARHGVIWPPNFTPTWRMLERARGGSLLTGENGDELFGAKRITPVTNILKAMKARRRPDPRLYPLAANALAATRRQRLAAQAARCDRFWLRKPVDSMMAALDDADIKAYSLHAGRHAYQFSTRRAASLSYRSLQVLGQDIGTTYVQPFSELPFVDAVARAAGIFGWSGRNQAMQRLFGDVLTLDILCRQSKAVFNGTVFTEHTRSFVRDWDGSGVDVDLVDPQALKENWLSNFPHGMTAALLQQAWLATQSTANRSTARI